MTNKQIQMLRDIENKAHWPLLRSLLKFDQVQHDGLERDMVWSAIVPDSMGMQYVLAHVDNPAMSEFVSWCGKETMRDIVEWNHLVWFQVPFGCNDLHLLSSLTGDILEDRDLTEADLATLDLECAGLCRTCLAGVDLEGFDLWSSSMWEANLQGANLKNTNLKGAELMNANLRDADLRGADLEGAELRYADLEGAVYDDSTRFPFGFIITHGMVKR